MESRTRWINVRPCLSMLRSRVLPANLAIAHQAWEKLSRLDLSRPFRQPRDTGSLLGNRLDRQTLATPMLTLRIRDCSIFFQSFFAKPVPFSTQRFEELSLQLLEAFASYNLRPSDISLDRGDGLFSYTLKVSLFSNLVSFMVDASHLEASFRNTNRESDREIVTICLKNILSVLGHLGIEIGSLNVVAHVACESEQLRNDYLKGFGRPGFTMGGALGYKTDTDYCKSVRLEVDQSYLFPDSLFINWQVSDLTNSYLLSEPHVWRKLFQIAEGFDLNVASDEQHG